MLKDPEILHKIEHQLTPPEKDKGGNAEQMQQSNGPPAPMFSYHDITIGALAWLAPHIQINPTVSFSWCSSSRLLHVKAVVILFFHCLNSVLFPVFFYCRDFHSLVIFLLFIFRFSSYEFFS